MRPPVLSREALAAESAAAIENLPPILGGHTVPEAVAAGADDFARLVGTLHIFDTTPGAVLLGLVLREIAAQPLAAGKIEPSHGQICCAAIMKGGRQVNGAGGFSTRRLAISGL